MTSLIYLWTKTYIVYEGAHTDLQKNLIHATQKLDSFDKKLIEWVMENATEICRISIVHSYNLIEPTIFDSGENTIDIFFSR